MKLYFAYGSNLNLAQMRVRCPKARPLHRVDLAGWKLVFRGVLDVVPSLGDTVCGGVYSITKDCERALDRYEGYPHFYIKAQIRLARDVTAMMYVMKSDRKGCARPPSKFYYEAVLQGFADWRIPPRTLRRALRSSAVNQENIIDTDNEKDLLTA